MEAATCGGSGDRGLRNLRDKGCPQVVVVATEAFRTFMNKGCQQNDPMSKHNHVIQPEGFQSLIDEMI
jgi:hypothetical protein